MNERGSGAVVRGVVAAWLLVAACTAASAGQPPAFAALGGTGAGVSADGNVVMGETTHDTVFRWTWDGGIELLGTLPGAGSDVRSAAVDAGVVVGTRTRTGTQGFRWSAATGIQYLDALPGSSGSTAYGISANAQIVAGGAGSPLGTQAATWTSMGVRGLGDLPGGAYHCVARGISADGKVVVGYGSGVGGEEAFRWTEDEGMVGLGDLPGSVFDSYATAASSDGSVIVGGGASLIGDEPFRWSEDEGMVGLGDLPGGNTAGEATAVSADGNVVVGEVHSAAGRTAFIWTEKHGMLDLKLYLLDLGLSELSNWKLQRATGISADGTTIIGTGWNGSRPDGWVARIPEPTTLTMLLIMAASGITRRSVM